MILHRNSLTYNYEVVTRGITMFIFRTTLSLIISFSAMYVNDICNKEFSSPHFKEPCLFLDQQSITVMQPNSHSEKTSSNYADNIWTSYPRASKLPITLLPIHICVCLSLKAWLLHTVCVCVCGTALFLTVSTAHPYVPSLMPGRPQLLQPTLLSPSPSPCSER